MESPAGRIATTRAVAWARSTRVTGQPPARLDAHGIAPGLGRRAVYVVQMSGTYPRRVDPTKPVPVVLTGFEREVISRGLYEWLGPGRPTEEMARAMGFAGSVAMEEDAARLALWVESEVPMSPTDWVRALLAAQIAFISSWMGSGHSWEIDTALSEHPSLDALRSAELKITQVIKTSHVVLGQVFGTFADADD